MRTTVTINLPRGYRLRDAGEFEESKHPRAKGGEFAKQAGGGGGGRAKEGVPRSTGPSSSSASEAPASSLYAKYAASVPTTEAARIAKGAEIAERQGATEQVAAAREKLKSAVPTNALVADGGHVQPDGKYTPERTALHETLLAEIFTVDALGRAMPDEGQKPVMTVLGGRGGSGKSWLTGKDGPVDAEKAIVVDADRFKSRLPEYQGWNAALLHAESSHLVDRAARMAAEAGVNVVFDATLRSSTAAQARIAEFGNQGYDVHGYYMFAAPETATERAIGRFVRGGDKGRFVPPEIVMANVDNEKNFDAVIPLFKRWGVYDNNDPLGTAPQHVASGGE